jgi:hypothetical protein
MSTMISFGPAILDRMVRAVELELVRERLLRTTSALDTAEIPYAICGGNAVSTWISNTDESAIRNTQDVDVLLRPMDVLRAIPVMVAAGFVHRRVVSEDQFLDGEEGRERESVKVHVVGLATSRHALLPNPDIGRVARLENEPYAVLELPELVEMLLSDHRREDRVLVRDLADVGLVDESWLTRVHPILAPRLKALLDDPEG